jgi:hypothetical protein
MEVHDRPGPEVADDPIIQQMIEVVRSREDSELAEFADDNGAPRTDFAQWVNEQYKKLSVEQDRQVVSHHMRWAPWVILAKVFPYEMRRLREL